MLSVELDRQAAKYSPGEVLVAEYKIDVETSQIVEAVECSVIWVTAGIGDEDVGVHFFERRSKSTLTADHLRKPHRISTVLPLSPLSYPGDLIQLTWGVRLRVFVSGNQYIDDCQFQLGNVSLDDYELLG